MNDKGAQFREDTAAHFNYMPQKVQYSSGVGHDWPDSWCLTAPRLSAGLDAPLMSLARQQVHMTHDTPNGADEDRRWCDTCQLSVAPTDDEEPTCPACGGPL